MFLKAESVPNLDSYKLFNPLFNSQDTSEAPEAKLRVRIFLKALYGYPKEALKD
ncbi:hypothetical protein F4678DRAFT_425161 [Xylaria arbuscula]|nr:hypothetical protein F4678DRAFT_425161 [Xylaria arbuscula]